MSAVIKPLTLARTSKMVDMAGQLDEDIKRLQEQLGEIKEALKLLGPGTYRGKLFKTTVSVESSTRLDSAIVKGMLTPAQVAIASKTSESTIVRIKRG